MRVIFAHIITQIAQIFDEIFWEPKTSEENRTVYLHNFRPDCPACNTQSLLRSDWLTYIYVTHHRFTHLTPVTDVPIPFRLVGIIGYG